MTELSRLPQNSEGMYLTDGGLETTMIFQENQELPYFAACELLRSEDGCNVLHKYFSSYAELASNNKTNFILETPTWRANPSWGGLLGYSIEELIELNKRAVALCKDIRDSYQSEECHILISGCMGPNGDGYVADEALSVSEAQAFHSTQIRALLEGGVDLVSAFTMSYVEEAVGLALAAKELKVPVVISFTVETDGHLPTGMSLMEAIRTVDEVTDGYVSYYMINCAHPSHFESVLNDNEPWLSRIGGLRANASCKSHAELDEATELDEGNPSDLAMSYRGLMDKFKNIRVIGGCCGTSLKHIDAMYHACSH